MIINTRKQAIDEKCKDCIYDSAAGGTWREQTENCIDFNCSLFTFRPLTQATIVKLKQERYDNMTDEEKARADAKAEAARKRFKQNNP